MAKERVFMKKIQKIINGNSIVLALVVMAIVFIISNIKIEKENIQTEARILDSGMELNMKDPEPEIAFVETNEIELVMKSSNTVRFTEYELSEIPEVETEVQTEEIIEETEIEEETVEPEVVVPVRVIPCSDEDYNNFIRIVEAETTGGDLMSKILVADVIINRVRSPRFPATITEVIFQGNGEQFQPVSDGRFYTVPVTSVTIEAVERALLGEDYSMGATFFAATRSAYPGSWHDRALTRLFEYGGHVYFTF